MHVPCPCHARYAHATHFLSACCARAKRVVCTRLQSKKLDLRSANPLGALNLLLGRSGVLRGSAAAYFLVWLGNACINSQFGNYVNHLFGWGPQESAPLLVPAGTTLKPGTEPPPEPEPEPSPEPSLVGEGRQSRRPPPRDPLRTLSLPHSLPRCSSA